MEVSMRIFRWDDDLAVQLPQALIDELGLKEGDELQLVAASKETIEVETNEQRRQRAIEQIASSKLRLPLDYKFDRDEANER
jgi:antitoxin MazE